jgi:Fe/S biogenesis protein NfuA
MSVLLITDAAAKVVTDLLAAEADAATLALKVDVIGLASNGREYSYELLFETMDKAAEGDDLDPDAKPPVLIPAASVDKLRGATLDHVEPTGLVIRNPNRPSKALSAETPLPLDGSVEQRIVALIDGEINPSLDAHGGYAQLQRVEGDTAFIIMGGGCQGCGLAAVTLSEGIKATIEERIPEITKVVDVTEHAAGENPFFV